MRILVISPYPVFPVETGSAVRTYQICHYLMNENHDVFLLAPSGRITKITPSINICIYTFQHRWGFQHFFNPEVLKKIETIVKDHHIDLIFLSFPYQGLMVMRVAHKFGIPFMLDEHNVEFLRFYKMKRYLLSTFLKFVEKRVVQSSEQVFAVSEKEQQIIKECFNVETTLMPNGVDVSEFSPDENGHKLRDKLDLKEVFVVLFFGALDYLPNREAVSLVNDYIAPAVTKECSEVVFLIAGKKPPELNWHSSVRVVGSVNNIKEYINMSDLVICPLLAGGGTRIKILESLACGKTVLSTPIGAEGLRVENNNNIIIAELDDFPDKILKTINGSDETQISANARLLALEYDWENTLKPLKCIADFL